MWDSEYSHISDTPDPNQGIRDYYLQSDETNIDHDFNFDQPITKPRKSDIDIDVDEISSLSKKKHKKKEEKYSDLYSLAGDWFKHIHYKCLIFVFVMFILLCSDVFIRILANIEGAVDEMTMTPTTTGVVIQGVILVIALIAFFTIIGLND